MTPSRIHTVKIIQMPKHTGDGTYLVEIVDDPNIKGDKHSILAKHAIGLFHVGDTTSMWHILTELHSYRGIGDAWGRSK